MKKPEKIQLLDKAEQYLQENPQDINHDLSHAIRVWSLAKEICGRSDVSVDEDLLHVICYWHDVEVPGVDISEGKRVADVTAEYLSDLVNDRNEKQVVFDSIANHEFGSTPNYIEGKILQDADKLELFSQERIDKAVKAINAGNYSREKGVQVLEMMINDWFPKFPGILNLEYSREKFVESKGRYLKRLTKALESIYIRR